MLVERWVRVFFYCFRQLFSIVNNVCVNNIFLSQQLKIEQNRCADKFTMATDLIVNTAPIVPQSLYGFFFKDCSLTLESLWS